MKQDKLSESGWPGLEDEHDCLNQDGRDYKIFRINGILVATFFTSCKS